MRRKVQMMKRTFTALGLCVVMAAAPAGIANAEEIGEGEAVTVTDVQDVEYDLGKGGTQSFEIMDEDREETEIVVEKVPGMARVANGTYKISAKRKLCWTAGFYVDISGNKIAKAHDRFYKTKNGSVKNAQLKKTAMLRLHCLLIMKMER